MNMNFGGSSWDGLMGKVIIIATVLFAVAVIYSFAAITGNNTNIAQACAFINAQAGYSCIAGADEAKIFYRDGTRTATGSWNLNGNPITGLSGLTTANGAAIQNAGGTAVITLSVGAANVTTGALQVGGVPVLTETGTQTISNKTISGPLTFADASANPDANGELQRNGANLLYYNGTDARNFLHQMMQSGACATYVVSSTAPAALITAATEAKKDYGAAIQLADGTADQTEVNAAIAADPNGRLCMSPGVFNTTGTIANTGNPDVVSGFSMVGAGMGDYLTGSSQVSEIVYSGAGVAIQIGNGVFEGGPRNMSISDLRLTGNASATKGIYINAAPRTTVERVNINGFTGVGSYAIDADQDNPGTLIQRNSIQGNDNAIRFRFESAMSVIRQNRIAANAGVGIICGATGDSFHPIQLTITENILSSNAGGNLENESCRHIKILDNHFIASSAAATEVMIRIGGATGNLDLETVTISNNWFRGRGTSNDAVLISTNARYSILTFSNNNCHDWAQSCLDNTNVAVSTDNFGWILDTGDNQFTDGSGSATSTHNLFAVSGAAGGVIRAKSRDDYVAAVQSIVGPDAFLFVPDYSDGLVSVDAGRNDFEVDWYVLNTPTSVQAWATKPLRLGNGLSYTTSQAQKTHGRIDDADWWTWNDGSDIPVTLISLIRPTVAQQNPIFTKFDLTTGTEAREWRFFVANSTNALTYRQYDESEGDTYIGRVSDTGLTDDRYALVAVTNNTTGASTADNLALYAWDGATFSGLMASTAADNGSYVAMENTAAQPWINSYKETAAVGNACECNLGLTVAVRNDALTEDELWLVAALTQAYTGIPLTN